MKKKSIPIIFLIVVVIVIYSIGSVRKQARQQQDASLEHVSQAEDGESDDLPSSEEEMMKNIAEDRKRVEKEGNIFPMGSYQLEEGFGYKILDFKKYDSYEAFKAGVDGFNEDNVILDVPAERFEGKGTYFYVEMEITNDASCAERVYQGIPQLYLAENGDTTIRSNPDLAFDNRRDPIYIGGVTKHGEEPGKKFNPLLAAGESVILQYGFECCYESTDEYFRIQDVTDSEEYYLQIPNAMSEDGYPEKLEDDKMHIYFKCEPQEGEESE